MEYRSTIPMVSSGVNRIGMSYILVGLDSASPNHPGPPNRRRQRGYVSLTVAIDAPSPKAPIPLGAVAAGIGLREPMAPVTPARPDGSARPGFP